LLHELAMIGVGGNSIESVKNNLSLFEVKQWAAYRELRGSFNIGIRIERAAALIASLYVNSKSKYGGFTVYDFMPHEDEPPISLDKAIDTWH
jgi:hypothetical protein